MQWSIGVDVGGTTTRVCALNPAFEVTGTVRRPTGIGPQRLVEGIEAAIVDGLEACDTRPTLIGVGLPGRVDHRRGTVTDGVNIGLDGTALPLASMIERTFGIRVHLENDVNAAALGAAHLMFDDLASTDLAYLSIGTGLAAGFVLGGELRRGVSGSAGEIGHLSVDPLGRRCTCGQRGCIEAMASGGALARRRVTAPGESPVAALLADHLAGDTAATAIWHEMTAGLAAAVDTISLTVDPGTIVIGGGVADIGRALIDGIIEQLARRHATSPYHRVLAIPDRLRLAPPGLELGAVGAAIAATAAAATEPTTETGARTWAGQ